MEITIYKDLFNTNSGAFYFDISKALDRIKIGSSKELLKQIRHETSKDKQNELKKNLPCFLFSGKFSKRSDNGLVEHSGFICLDFDEFDNSEQLEEWRQKLEADKYTYSVFLSPRENGLKVIVKIPKCDKNEHKLYFTALENYFDCKYFDTSCKNVSRVCYESYDPNIYINTDSEIFTEKADEVYAPIDTTEPTIILNDEQQIIDKLVKWWDSNFGYVKGERNNNLFKLASAFNDYGVSKESGENYVLTNIVQGDMSQREISMLFSSAYRNIGSHASKFFEDNNTLKRVKSQIKKGVEVSEIVKTVPNVSTEVIEDIKNNSNDHVFWVFVKSGKTTKVSIDSMLFRNYLESEGFFKYYEKEGNAPIFVRVIKNKVNISSVNQIKDFVLKYLEEIGELKVWSLMSNSNKYFTDSYLSFLSSIDLKMVADTKDTVYIFYQNGAVKVTKEDCQLLDYFDLNGYVWENQIQKRDFVKLEKHNSVFERFISLISAETPKRIQALETSLGYMLSSHKNKSEQKSVIYNDENIEDGLPNGGSGKSLLIEAIGFFKKVVTIDGKQFDPNKTSFAYQRVSLDTQLLVFDDVKRNFNFEKLFSLITQGITVNRKNKDEIYIPFEQSPKVAITTNYVVAGAGSSNNRRRHEIELHQYFNEFNTPYDVFGHYFFDDWNKDQWANFDNYMIECLKKYLLLGLTKAESINAANKRLIQATSKDFYDFVNDDRICAEVQYYTNDIVQEFSQEFNFKSLTNQRFITWVKFYANFKGWKYESIRMPKRGFILRGKTKENKEHETLPF
jgi:hypothetical protein